MEQALLVSHHATTQFPSYWVVLQRLRLVPNPGIISSLLGKIMCLFGYETNHKLGTEVPVLLSKKKFAAEVTLCWWVSTVLKN